MRRTVQCLTAASLLLAQPAWADPQCLPPAARAVFNVEALRSEMMVLATGCSDDTAYNAFIERYQPALQANEREIDAWFKRNFGRLGQSEHDRFVTDLANAQSSDGTRLGSDFCPHNGVIFHEVMALPDAGDLAPFAAGKNLVPAALDLCAEEAHEAAKKPVARRVAGKRH